MPLALSQCKLNTTTYVTKCNASERLSPNHTQSWYKHHSSTFGTKNSTHLPPQFAMSNHQCQKVSAKRKNPRTKSKITITEAPKSPTTHTSKFRPSIHHWSTIVGTEHTTNADILRFRLGQRHSENRRDEKGEENGEEDLYVLVGMGGWAEGELTWHFIVAISLRSWVSSWVGLFDQWSVGLKSCFLLYACLSYYALTDGFIKVYARGGRKELSLKAEASLL